MELAVRVPHRPARARGSLGLLIALSLFGGALADRFDRRRLLLGKMQIALVVVASGLAAAALAGLLPRSGCCTCSSGRSVPLPRRSSGSRASPWCLGFCVWPERLRSAVSLTFGLIQLTMVAGPALGGLLIAAAGSREGAYIADAVSCAGMVLAAYAMTAQPPKKQQEGDRADLQVDQDRPQVRAGVNMRSSARLPIDLCAMTFGMPRALFPVLWLTVYHAGASGYGRALRGRGRRGHRGRAHHGLARARALARPDRARRGGRLGHRRSRSRV